MPHDQGQVYSHDLPKWFQIAVPALKVGCMGLNFQDRCFWCSPPSPPSKQIFLFFAPPLYIHMHLSKQFHICSNTVSRHHRVCHAGSGSASTEQRCGPHSTHVDRTHSDSAPVSCRDTEDKEKVPAHGIGVMWT